MKRCWINLRRRFLHFGWRFPNSGAQQPMSAALGTRQRFNITAQKVTDRKGQLIVGQTNWNAKCEGCAGSPPSHFFPTNRFLGSQSISCLYHEIQTSTWITLLFNSLHPRSVCIFFLLSSKQVLTSELFLTKKVGLVGDHFLYSRNHNEWLTGDIVGRR